jgi:branched-subunit amino acid transport protein AzlD
MTFIKIPLIFTRKTNLLNKKYNKRITLLSNKIENDKIENDKPKFYNPFIGSTLGIPLNIMQAIFTYNYYHANLIDLRLIALQFGIGSFTYGTDRLLDCSNYYNYILQNSKNISIVNINNLNQLESYNNSLHNEVINIYSQEKVDYYNFLLNNLYTSYLTLLTSYCYVGYNLLIENQGYIMFLALTSTLGYKPFKKNFGQLKALYIGTFWTLGTLVMPTLLIDHNYNILNDPNNYLPLFLIMFGSSNLLDNKDIIEDKIENINTLPVLYGNKTSTLISYSSFFFAFFIFINKYNGA